MFIDFTVRFIWFFIKVTTACVFVVILQLRVGERSLEQILDQALKKSTIGVYFQNLTKTGAEMVGNNVKDWISNEDSSRSIATPPAEPVESVEPAEPVEHIDTSSVPDSSIQPLSAP